MFYKSYFCTFLFAFKLEFDVNNNEAHLNFNYTLKKAYIEVFEIF